MSQPSPGAEDERIFVSEAERSQLERFLRRTAAIRRMHEHINQCKSELNTGILAFVELVPSSAQAPNVPAAPAPASAELLQAQQAWVERANALLALTEQFRRVWVQWDKEDASMMTKFSLSALPPIPPLKRIGTATATPSPVPCRTIDAECHFCLKKFGARDLVVWCKNGCGRVVHRICFDEWKITCFLNAKLITCIFCRKEWEEQDASMFAELSGVEDLRMNV